MTTILNQKKFDFTAPSAPGDFVRVVGYAVDDYSNDVLVYFKIFEHYNYS